MFAKVAVAYFALALVGAFAAPASLGDGAVERASRFGCMGTVQYQVIVDFLWSGATHGAGYPASGMLSPHVSASHGEFWNVWLPLGWSSKGVQDVAETGDTTALWDLLGAQVGRNVRSRKRESGPSTGTETVRSRLRLTPGRSYITSIAMLAPSPDWFTGIEKVNLCNTETGEWYDELTGNLSAWDAGTDAGTEFTSEDSPIIDFQRLPIISILGSTFGGIPIGTYTLRKV